MGAAPAVQAHEVGAITGIKLTKASLKYRQPRHLAKLQDEHGWYVYQGAFGNLNSVKLRAGSTKAVLFYHFHSILQI